MPAKRLSTVNKRSYPLVLRLRAKPAAGGRSMRYFQAATELLVPDNLRSGVTKTHRYELDLNPTYQDMGQHYTVAVIPARVFRPKDYASNS
jgi:hypothetical protein